ncbi:MAG: hypothetical protein PHY48_09345 [Candidatus Cloacimonetes bacterium]|nr:hypothetical protein [Candidatus Cloacimonadota bacterium]
MKTKTKMPKRTQHCDTEKAKHCDTFATLGEFKPDNAPLTLLAKDLSTCRTASGTVTSTSSCRLSGIEVGTVTDDCVTVLIQKSNEEYRGIVMTKRIEAVWLTIERMAELKSCSNRTVWRYIDKHKMLTVKRQVQIGSAKVIKTFVLPDPETLMLEFSDSRAKSLKPDNYLETTIPVGKRLVKSMLVCCYTTNVGTKERV